MMLDSPLYGYLFPRLIDTGIQSSREDMGLDIYGYTSDCNYDFVSLSLATPLF
jgi:hypothetical protein